MWRSKEAVHQFFVGVGAAVLHEGIDFREARRKSGEIEAEATNERDAICFRRWPDVLLREAGEDEGVDGVYDFGFTIYELRRGRVCGRDERPVDSFLRSFVGGGDGTGIDPASDERDLCFAQWRFLVGHPREAVVRPVDDLNEQALSAPARLEGRAVLAALECGCRRIQTHSIFLL